MTAAVGFQRHGQVALLTLDGPAENALGPDMRRRLMAALDRAEADAGIAALVICGAGRGFSGGLDMRTLAPATDAPDLARICDRIEGLAKPVIAALHGYALGGGFELALAADWRLAAAGTKIGFPEVTLGLVPGAGGTYRAPRLAGAERVLEMMLTGAPAPADAADGLIDGVLQGDVVEAALTLAEDLAGKGIGLRPTTARKTGFADPRAYLQAVAEARAAFGPHTPLAARRCVDCIEAALLLPLDQARVYEREAFDTCRDTAEARSLTHAFLVEKRATLRPDGAAPGVQVAGFLGAGPGVAALTKALLDAKVAVMIWTPEAAARKACIARIETAYLEAIEAGELTEDEAVATLAPLEAVSDLARFKSCDLVVEAMGSPLAETRAVLAQVDPLLPAGALLASLNAQVDIEVFAQATTRPERVIGLHPDAAAIEISSGPLTAESALGTGFDLAERLGRKALRLGPSTLGVGASVIRAERTAVDHLLLVGATPDEVDAAMAVMGFAEGPCARADRLAQGALGERLAAGLVSARLAEAGLGYHEEAALPVLDALRREHGVTVRAVAPAEIRLRLLTAMAAEGARLVASGAVRDPGLVDAVMLLAHGFPRHLGGPMQWADERGLAVLRQAMRAWAEEADIWAADPIWDDLIKNGRRFGDLCP